MVARSFDANQAHIQSGCLLRIWQVVPLLIPYHGPSGISEAYSGLDGTGSALQHLAYCSRKIITTNDLAYHFTEPISCSFPLLDALSGTPKFSHQICGNKLPYIAPPLVTSTVNIRLCI
jgi:hypothetical protein